MLTSSFWAKLGLLNLIKKWKHCCVLPMTAEVLSSQARWNLKLKTPWALCVGFFCSPTSISLWSLWCLRPSYYWFIMMFLYACLLLAVISVMTVVSSANLLQIQQELKFGVWASNLVNLQTAIRIQFLYKKLYPKLHSLYVQNNLLLSIHARK